MESLRARAVPVGKPARCLFRTLFGTSLELGVQKLNPIGLGSMAADRPDELECCCQKEKQDQSGHYGCLCGRCMCIQLQLLYCCDSYEPWLSVTFY